MNTAIKQDALAFIAERFLCVISTVGADYKPESAMVAYCSNVAHELIIGTSNKSRKFKNIEQNRAVAVVIADQIGEVQYEGEAEIIVPADYEALLTSGRFEKLPGFDKYRGDPTQVYVLIKPTWMRFIVHGQPDQITEFTEF